MSSKKAVKITLDGLILEKLDEEKRQERRTRSSMVEKVLADRYGVEVAPEKNHAHQT